MTPYYSDPWLTVYQGHVLDVLRELPEESVHCVVTSPPYWGLRDYGLPPVVWGGDPTHQHEWTTSSRATEIGGGNWAQGVNGRGEEQPGGVEGKREPVRSSAQTGSCSCGAWRGSLGLEPTPDCGAAGMLRLRRDLSPSQREYVVRRLTGVIGPDDVPDGRGGKVSRHSRRRNGGSDVRPTT